MTKIFSNATKWKVVFSILKLRLGMKWTVPLALVAYLLGFITELPEWV